MVNGLKFQLMQRKLQQIKRGIMRKWNRIVLTLFFPLFQIISCPSINVKLSISLNFDGAKRGSMQTSTLRPVSSRKKYKISLMKMSRAQLKTEFWIIGGQPISQRPTTNDQIRYGGSMQSVYLRKPYIALGRFMLKPIRLFPLLAIFDIIL